MKTMYYAYYSMNKIEEVQVESETKEFIQVVGRARRDKKFTDYGSYHDSKEEALQAIKDTIQTDINYNLDQAKKYQGKMNDLINRYW